MPIDCCRLPGTSPLFRPYFKGFLGPEVELPDDFPGLFLREIQVRLAEAEARPPK
jgi:hypothetical protein